MKYSSDEERIKAYRKQQNNYSEKKWKCDICDCIIRLGNKTNHVQGSKHIGNLNGDIKKIKDKMWHCGVCSLDMLRNSKYNHFKTARHDRNLTATVNDPIIEPSEYNPEQYQAYKNSLVEPSKREISDGWPSFEQYQAYKNSNTVEPSEFKIPDGCPRFEQYQAYKNSIVVKPSERKIPDGWPSFEQIYGRRPCWGNT